MQLDLLTIPPPIPEEEVKWLIDFLRDKDWLTAEQILTQMGQPAVESTKRRIRFIASNSSGRIGSGQHGYKLVKSMTSAEYNHFRNGMSSQASEMTKRILLSDREFYRRKPVAPVVPGPLPAITA
jgi:hypothetical protein